MFPNIRWNEKNDVIIFCFLDEIDVITFCLPILDEMKRHNDVDNEKNDVIIFCFPILDEMKRMTS